MKSDLTYDQARHLPYTRRPEHRDSIRIVVVCHDCEAVIGDDVWPATTFDRDLPEWWASGALVMYGALHEAEAPGHDQHESTWHALAPAPAPRHVHPTRTHRLGTIE